MSFTSLNMYNVCVDICAFDNSRFVCLFLAAGSEREQHITVPGRVQRGRGDWFRELRNRLQVHQQTRSVWGAVR